MAVDANGKTYFIEVEVEANKNQEQRQTKWRNALQASGGQIYAFCDNRSCMRAIRSEINFSLGRQVGQCCLTNLVDLQAGKRASDGGIWLGYPAKPVLFNRGGWYEPPGINPPLVVRTPWFNPGLYQVQTGVTT